MGGEYNIRQKPLQWTASKVGQENTGESTESPTYMYHSWECEDGEHTLAYWRCVVKGLLMLLVALMPEHDDKCGREISLDPACVLLATRDALCAHTRKKR